MQGTEAGFTLIEVLVATAITGISLGVLMSTIAQGHRQAFRGDMERQAGMIAVRIMQQAAIDRDIQESSGEIEELPGWHYSMELREPDIEITDNINETVEVNIEGLSELVLTITPPNNGRAFVISRLVKSSE
jgi:prepilin-type N-terminal cleavage/methylation domain-containing protein